MHCISLQERMAASLCSNIPLRSCSHSILHLPKSIATCASPQASLNFTPLTPPSLNQQSRVCNMNRTHLYPLDLLATRKGKVHKRGGVHYDSLSSASSVEEESSEVPEGSMEGSPEGFSPQVRDGLTREKVMQEVMQRLTEEDLEASAQKYNIEEELFAEIDYAQINVFTDRAFGGNPAAVCYLPYEKDTKWLQLIAREFNLSETAFLVKRRNTRKIVNKEGSKENEFDLRWFTPTVEVDLCGHATLASAHLLFASGIVEGKTVLFHTKSGILRASKVSGYEEYEQEAPEDEERMPERKRPGGKGVVELDFPLVPAASCNDISLLSEALGGVDVKWVGETSLGDYLVELPSSEDVESVKPQLHKMVGFHGRGGVMVTALASADSPYDFVSRFFCPKSGISEVHNYYEVDGWKLLGCCNKDPATGSAHCTLGPYWAAKLGKNELKSFQASERGGKFLVRVDKGTDRCYIQGGAVLVMAGVLLNTMQS